MSIAATDGRRTELSDPLLHAQGIRKSFGGVTVLDDVDLTLRAGEVVALAGENGAGKSTLIKIITGVYQPDAGTITIAGSATDLTPARAKDLGIAAVAQELSTLDHLSITDNVFLGRELRGRMGLVDRKAQHAAAQDLLARVGLEVSPDTMARDLSLAQRQLVEISKALATSPRVLVLDEPTSGLREQDVERLLTLIAQLRDEGHALLLVTHRMSEMFTCADRIAVLKDGRHVGTVSTRDTSENEVVRMMVGRELASIFPPKAQDASGPSVLEVRGLSVVGTAVADIDLDVPRGAIVALAGLAGQGQTQLLEGIGGLRPARGRVRIGGRDHTAFRGVRQAAQAGIVLIPEDRKTQGLVLPMTVGENISLPTLARRARGGWIDTRAEATLAAETVERMAIRPPRVDAVARSLSGGNQQKIVIGKWLASDPRVVLCADPTRGIDVGTKQEIYRLLRELAADGVGILMLSTDLTEVVGLADQVLVMAEGRIVGHFTGSDITEENITSAAFKGVDDGAA